jgi:hypothetical protein
MVVGVVDPAEGREGLAEVDPSLRIVDVGEGEVLLLSPRGGGDEQEGQQDAGGPDAAQG